MKITRLFEGGRFFGKPSCSEWNRMRMKGALYASLIIAVSAVSDAANPLEVWKGADTLGGDGVWNAANFNGTLPTVNRDVLFKVDSQLTQVNARVTADAAINAANFRVEEGKNLTLALGSNGYLTVTTTLTVGIQAAGATPISSKLVIQGPETGRAKADIGRIYLSSSANSGTAFRNDVIIDGKVDVNLTGSFTNASGHSSIVFNGGSTVTSGTSGIYSRAGDVNGIYENNIAFLKTDVKAVLIEAYGLVQFGKESTLSLNGTLTSPQEGNLLVARNRDTGALGTKNGRLEVEGSGIAAGIKTVVYKNGTLAVGLSDPNTMIRAQAETFTVNGNVVFKDGSFVELGIFNNTEADKIIFNTGNFEGIFNLTLKVHNGASLTAGTSFTLFDFIGAETGLDNVTVKLGMIDTQLWDLSQFNKAGGWVVTVIPEPSSVGMALVSFVAGGLFLARRRKGCTV